MITEAEFCRSANWREVITTDRTVTVQTIAVTDGLTAEVVRQLEPYVVDQFGVPAFLTRVQVRTADSLMWRSPWLPLWECNVRTVAWDLLTGYLTRNNHDDIFD